MVCVVNKIIKHLGPISHPVVESVVKCMVIITSLYEAISGHY